jgi:uncharacterized delta-60 repeat protein
MATVSRLRRLLRMAVVPSFVLLQAFGATPALAAAGDLDPSLGGDGRVTGPGGDAVAMALQADGKIVMAGLRQDHFVVARYDTSGSLDPTFGGVGWVTTSFGDVGCGDLANAVLVQPDGGIVAAGFSRSMSGCLAEFALARYGTDGSLDASFGGDGLVTTHLGGPHCTSSAQGATIQPDGSLIAAGWRACSGVVAFAVVRYLPDGTLDQSFGRNGIVLTDLSPYFDQASDVEVEPDGSIVAAGTANLYGHGKFAIVRYHPDGTRDRTFGGDGTVKTSFRPVGCAPSTAETLALQADGPIVVGGMTSCGPPDFALVRYLPNGALDPSFDGDGRVTTLLTDGDCSDHVYGLAIQSDGKLVADGAAGCITDGSFGLARYLPDGSLDATFGGDGTIATTFANGCFAQGEDVVIEAGGTILAGGVSTCRHERFALARYAA